MKNLKSLFLLLFLSTFTLHAQSRSEIQAQIETIATGVPNTALKIRNVLAVLADGVAQTGDVKEIDVSNAYLLANFDPTGLGINERLGWAICNGNNGTRNRGGRVAIQYNTTYPTLGAVGGESTHVLTLNEMPSHSHVIKGSVNTSGGSGANSVSNTSNNGPDMTTNTSGGGQAHNIMQPYIVSVFIMKLP